MIVHWTENCMKIVPKMDKENGIVGDVVLAPGYNDVADEEWAQARDTAKRDLDTGRIVEEWVKAEKAKGDAKPLISTEIDGVLMVPATLKDINRPKVIAVVKDTYHVPTLEKWMNEELRQDVRIELYNRIEEVTKRAKG